MSNEVEPDEDKEEVSMVPADAQINFIQRNPLTKTLKRIDRSTESAIAYLESVVKDEKATSKERMAAAQFLIEKKVAISDMVTRDALARSIAQSRLQLASAATQQKRIKDAGSGSGDDSDGPDNMPKYCPDIILNHENISKM